MALQTDAYSRFGNTPVTTYDHGAGPQVVFAPWVKPDVLIRKVPDNEITRYVVSKAKEGRPDLIANDVYGTDKLDWLVIAYNNALAVFNWPKAGQILKLPSSTFVASELL